MGTKIKQVGKSFGSVHALKNINLEIEKGEFVAILGPSGCGKTTLLRLLAGFDAPSSGSISVSDHEVANATFHLPPEKRNIGMVFQSFALWPHMNVKEHIQFPLKHHQFLSAEQRKNVNERVDEVLEMIGLQLLGNRMPSELSGGQKQRVALARAIAPKPALLLMDEPLSSLDAELRMIMRKEIQQLHRATGATIVYVTHDQGEALAMADKIVVMNEGNIEQIGSAEEIYCRPTSTFVATFVGKANLIEGRWNGNTFYPLHSSIQKWHGSEISPTIKKLNLYPVRPEQLSILHEQTGIPGVITNVQYQGKEFHYTVSVKGHNWTVHQSISTNFKIGDKVSIRLKE